MNEEYLTEKKLYERFDEAIGNIATNIGLSVTEVEERLGAIKTDDDDIILISVKGELLKKEVKQTMVKLSSDVQRVVDLSFGKGKFKVMRITKTMKKRKKKRR